MKRFILEFLKRGIFVSVGGPIIVGIVYFFLGLSGEIWYLEVNDVVLAIISSALLAFIAGGISAVHTIDRLPVFIAILIHGVVLYVDYIVIYLLNGWIEDSVLPIVIFTAIFIAAYAVIWLCVFLSQRKTAKKLNESLEVRKD